MISDEYTELLQEKLASNSNDSSSDLDEIFRIGQYVLGRVIQGDNENEQKQKRLHLTINPKDVCDQLTPENLVKGMVGVIEFCFIVIENEDLDATGCSVEHC